MTTVLGRKPPWLSKKLPDPQAVLRMRALLGKNRLHTICESANCPNLGECWGEAVATFLIMGDICTRRCGFCDVATGRPHSLDPEEPRHVAEAVRDLGLAHVVVTSVSRDDLADGGAGHFAATIEEIRHLCPGTTVEVLIPDLQGSQDCLEVVLAAQPTVLAHNVETVSHLHRQIRPCFRYDRSLRVLATSKRLSPHIYTKSSLMVGLGESEVEVLAALADLRQVGCDFVTVGQYLRPSREHTPVVEYVRPELFERYREAALTMGFQHVASGPFVRSSYGAAAALSDAGPALQLEVGSDQRSSRK